MRWGVFPILYKRTATGAIQKWQIAVEKGTTIVTVYGQVGGKLQSTKNSVKAGKNKGRKNETAPEEQALKEAKSQWLKKKKAGYVESLKDAESGKTDSVIEGGIVPMTAKKFEDHSDKIIYPVAVQPKLDGHRCIAVIDKDGDVSLWTRTRKRITSIPHIEDRLRELAKKLRLYGHILDGEIYNHSLRDNFEKLTSAARKKESSEDSKLLQYHVYDIVLDSCFKSRLGAISSIMTRGREIDVVATHLADNEEELMKYYDQYKDQGYEGVMVRQFGVGYEHKRSSQLLKVKGFMDDEFEIIGVEEGKGRLTGHAGAFICVTKDGKEFRAKMSGNTSKLAEYWKFRDDYVGSLLTVKYQGFTKDGKPRFPVGIRIREDL